MLTAPLPYRSRGSAARPTAARLLTMALAVLSAVAAALLGPHVWAAAVTEETTSEQQPALGGWTTEQMAAADEREVASIGGLPTSVVEMGQRATANSTESTAESTVPEGGVEAANPRFGKLFYRMGGLDYACSGTATASANGDVVATAGHCLYDGDYASDVVFVPAYDGLAPYPHLAQPYGVWTAQEVRPAPEWVASHDFTYDVGFVVLHENAQGQSLTDIVGGFEPSYDEAMAMDMHIYGYPGAAPYDGTQLRSCAGPVSQYVGSTWSRGVACPMTSGASGGGWISGDRLVSVTSYTRAEIPGVVFGPTLDQHVRSLFDAAAAVE